MIFEHVDKKLTYKSNCFFSPLPPQKHMQKEKKRKTSDFKSKQQRKIIVNDVYNDVVRYNKNAN